MVEVSSGGGEGIINVERLTEINCLSGKIFPLRFSLKYDDRMCKVFLSLGHPNY